MFYDRFNGSAIHSQLFELAASLYMHTFAKLLIWQASTAIRHEPNIPGDWPLSDQHYQDSKFDCQVCSCWNSHHPYLEVLTCPLSCSLASLMNYSNPDLEKPILMFHKKPKMFSMNSWYGRKYKYQCIGFMICLSQLLFFFTQYLTEHGTTWT